VLIGLPVAACCRRRQWHEDELREGVEVDPIRNPLRRRVRGGFSPPSLFSRPDRRVDRPSGWTPQSGPSVPATVTGAKAYR